MDQIEQISHTIHNLGSARRSHTFWGLILVLLLSSAWVWYEHSEWATSLNEHMLGPSADGFKNYMVSSWHVAHDSSYTHYDGMNYPYGEHVLFTDNQPILNGAMQWWSANVSPLNGRVVGVLNWIQLFSIVLGCGVMFLLFRKLHVPVWYAGLASIGVIFLSPQYLRFDVHFALSHTWIFPLLLYLLSGYEERYSRRYQSLMIGLLVWVAGQIHFYYFGLAALFLGAYTGFHLLADRSWRNWRVRMSHLVVMVLLPMALLNVWSRWTDHVVDRPAYPFGFMSYTADWRGIFLPYKSFPLSKWIGAHVTPLNYNLNSESIGYLGLVAVLFTLYALFSRYRIFPATWDEAAYHRVHKKYLWGILFAATMLLILSLGFPVSIKGMHWLQQYVGPIRQFRSLARFSWAYYYIIHLVAFYVIWNQAFRFKGYKIVKWLIAGLPLALLLYEAWQIQDINTEVLEPNVTRKEIAAAAPDHWLNKVDFTPYQALLPLPYYHVGSENIWRYKPEDSWHGRNVEITALHTGLPDMGVFLSRTSLNQTIKSIQFTMAPFEEAGLLEDLPDNRPIALLIDPKQEARAMESSAFLIRKARLIYTHKDMIIMSLSPDSLKSYRRTVMAEMKKEFEAAARIDLVHGWKSDVPPGFFYVQSYDSLSSSRFTFQGNGALEARFNDEVTLWNRSLPKGQYQLRLWLKANLDMGMTLKANIRQSVGAQELPELSVMLQDRLLGFADGWGLVEAVFEVKDEQTQVQIVLPSQYVSGHYYLDEVMLKSAGFQVYKRAPGWIVRNNEWYKM